MQWRGCRVFLSWLATELTWVLNAQLANSLCQPAYAKSFPHLSLRLSTPPRFVNLKWPVSVNGEFSRFCVGTFPVCLFIYLFIYLCTFSWLIFSVNYLFPKSLESDVPQRGRGLATRGCGPIRPAPGNHNISPVFVTTEADFVRLPNLLNSRLQPVAWPRVRVGLLCFPSVCIIAMCASYIWFFFFIHTQTSYVLHSALLLMSNLLFIYLCTFLAFCNVPTS